MTLLMEKKLVPLQCFLLLVAYYALQLVASDTVRSLLSHFDVTQIGGFTCVTLSTCILMLHFVS